MTARPTTSGSAPCRGCSPRRRPLRSWSSIPAPHSNTGGQASTASLSGQDSDLARFGSAHHGKQEDRKELGLIAAFHPNVFVVQTSTGMQGHFLKNVMAYLNHTSSPAVLDVYTPCQGEHGIADAAASQRSRLAVECRMSPVFVHNPGANTVLHGRFNLEGNPDLDKDWTKTSIQYVENGATKLMEVALTPAYFAKDETRFKKQFRKLAPDANAILIEDYVSLPISERAGKTAFVYSTDHDKRLIKVEVSNDIVHLVEERRKNWRTLQYLAGRQVEEPMPITRSNWSRFSSATRRRCRRRRARSTLSPRR